MNEQAKWAPLIAAMDSKATQTMANLTEAQVFNHNQSRGECIEAVTKEAIRAWLPKRYGLGSGVVIGADGTKSKALDIIIYDDLFSIVMEAAGGKVLCPAEAVFGTIEVKTQLNTADLDDSIEKGRSLTQISRPQTDGFQFTPLFGLRIDNQTIGGDLRPRNHYLAGIVAVRAMNPTKVLNGLSERRRNGEEHLPAFVTCLEDQWLIVKTTHNPETGHRTTGDTEWGFNEFTLLETGPRTITV
ncbi:MAG: hypothetical protein F4229_04765, partial [Gammaproteobacteria bacterium]|nr:hypothetical protein [Gammaproteobacteria bacterium]